MKKKLIAISLTVLFTVSTGYAASYFNKDSAGTTAAQFLKLGVGSRALSMGESFSALSDDISAIYWNPAGLINTRSFEVGAMHAIWFQDIMYSWLAYRQKALNGSLGIAVNYLSAGDIEGYDNIGTSADSYTAYDMLLTVSYARKIGNIPLGINLKTINSVIEEESAIGFAADIGTVYDLVKNKVGVGLVLQNFGTGLKYMSVTEKLPLNIKAGTYWQIADPLVVTLDANLPMDNSINGGIGAEYKVRMGNLTVSPRAGYKTKSLNDLDALAGLTAGAGLSMNSMTIDYVWVPYWKLGTTHRITASYRFGAGEEKDMPEKKVKKAVKKKKEKAKKIKKKAIDKKEEKTEELKDTKKAIEKKAAKPVEKSKKAAKKAVKKTESKKSNIQTKKSEFFGKGHSFFAQKRYKESIRYFEKVLALDPDHEQSKKYIQRAKRSLRYSR